MTTSLMNEIVTWQWAGKRPRRGYVVAMFYVPGHDEYSGVKLLVVDEERRLQELDACEVQCSPSWKFPPP